MTWGELKQKAEAAGVTDDSVVWYIDIDDGDDIKISLPATNNNDPGITIVNG